MGTNRLRIMILFGTILILFLIIGANRLTKNIITQKSTFVFENLDQKQVTDIFVQNISKETHIYQKNSQWKIQKDGIEYDADLDKVNMIIDAFVGLQKGEIVSNNRDKREEFGIGQQKLTLKTKTHSYSMYVGKNDTPDIVYVNIDSSNEVFTAAGLSDLFPSDDYRDLNPHLITDENNVNQVDLQYTDHSLSIQKKDNDWLGNGQKLTKEKVDFFINDIKTLKATDIVPPTQVDIQSYTLSFSFTVTENSQKISAEIYQKDKDTYYVKSSKASFIYQIPSVYVSSLQKEEKDFIN